MAGYYFAIKIKALFIKVLKYYITGSSKLQINLPFHKSISLIFFFFNWSLNLTLSSTLWIVYDSRSRGMFQWRLGAVLREAVPVTELWERLAFGICPFGTVRSQPAAFLAQGAHWLGLWETYIQHYLLVLVSLSVPPKELLLETLRLWESNQKCSVLSEVQDGLSAARGCSAASGCSSPGVARWKSGTCTWICGARFIYFLCVT